MAVQAAKDWPKPLINGQVDACLSISDRGLAYGDGVFETMRCQGHRLPLWRAHLERLLSSCDRLFIKVDKRQLEAQVQTMLEQIGAATELADRTGIVKIIVTRGEGGKGYRAPAPEDTAANTVIQYLPYVDQPECVESGVSLALCSQPLSANSALAGIKHLSRLEYVLAAHSMAPGFEGLGLLLGEQQQVIECLHHNIFICREGRLLTPLLTQYGVEGVMRRWIIEVGAPQLGIAVEEQNLALSDLYRAEEVFICNAVRGVWPVSGLAQNCWSPGTITRRIQAQIARLWNQVDAD